MQLRAKLLLLALSTLVLPFTGVAMVRQFEQLLRQTEGQVQLAAARTLARAVASRMEAPGDGPTWFAQPARQALALDGYDEDWRAQGLSMQSVAPGLSLALARSNHALFLFLTVEDLVRVRADAHWPRAAHADQVLLTISDANGEHRLRLASAAPGPLIVAPLPGSDSGEQRPPTLRGEWQEDGRGYRIELRFPSGYEPRALGVAALDFSDPAAPPRRIGSEQELRAVQSVPTHLTAELAELTGDDGVRATLTQRDGFVLARAGQFPARPAAQEQGFWKRLLHRLVAAKPPPPQVSDEEAMRLSSPELTQALSGEAALAWYALDHGRGLLLSTVAPIQREGRTIGALRLEREGEAVLLTGQALSRLLFGTLAAMFAVGLVLFAYAGHLGNRIRKLSRAAEQAIDREARGAAGSFVASGAQDEIGTLSRNFARLLDEIGAYADYLRGLAAKLSHELHTPIAVVRSSLENLESEQLPDSARTYVGRARDGVDRLAAIVRAMSEASRVERAIASAEPEDFDLRKLIADCAEGYRALLAPRELKTMLPPGPVPFHGAPDLIVQVLDKLIDNAKSFCPTDGWVLIGLAPLNDGVEIVVANQGPPLPEAMADRLFDSLVSLRDASQRHDGAPHLGFGLSVVKLIAQRHRGEAVAANLPQGNGVEFRILLRGMERPRPGSR